MCLFEIRILWLVQWVGFRPFLYKLCNQKKIKGGILNTSTWSVIMWLGIDKEDQIYDLIQSIKKDSPKLSRIDSISILRRKDISEVDFSILKILKSIPENGATILPPPDCIICNSCINEFYHKGNRRNWYIFNTCVDCWPKFSSIFNTPYDRENTSMSIFKMCQSCKSEYEDVNNRRFHAENISCPNCWPRLFLINSETRISISGDPILKCVELLREWKIVAIKGIWGYQLLLDASNSAAISKLRIRKERTYKPFAIMSSKIEDIEEFAHVSAFEKTILLSSEAPIVLLSWKKWAFPQELAPNLWKLGVMIAYSPLHKAIIDGNFKAVVCTSGNISGSPIEYRNDSAIESLSKIADYILWNDREIVIGLDDSVIIPIEHVSTPFKITIRRSRWYVPDSIPSPISIPEWMAVWADLKNTVSWGYENRIYPSQYTGDIKNFATRKFFHEVINHFQKIGKFSPKYIACDMHPNFYSAAHAKTLWLPIIEVQHHHAHMAACMVDNSLDEKVIWVIFDGMGHSDKQELWGWEFFIGGYKSFIRVGHIREFRLLGGDAAVKDGNRIAFSLLYDAFEGNISEFKDILPYSQDEIIFFEKMLVGNINSPHTSSAWRLFDGISAILGICSNADYEWQMAIELEALAENKIDLVLPPLPINFTEKDNIFIFDHTPLVRKIVELMKNGYQKDELSSAFHNAIITMITQATKKISEKSWLKKVVFSGGVFQNKLLVTWLVHAFENSEITPFFHKKLPPNDGGLSVWQLAIAGTNRKMNHSSDSI